MNKAVITVLAALVIGAGAFMITRDKDEPVETNSAQQTANPTSQTTEQSDAEEESPAAVITYTNDGFSPQTLTVSSGDTVTVKNESSRTIQFDSDPHPAHTENTELNVDTIRPGQSKSFTANRTGTFGYHDHLDDSETGTIIVE